MILIGRRMPSSRIFTFDDPQRYQAGIRAATAEVLPTTKGQFHAELMQIDLHRLWMQRQRETLPRICRGSINRDRIAIEFPVGASGFRHNGLDVSPGEIVFYSWDSDHDLSLAPTHTGSMSLTPVALASASRVLVGCELTVPLISHVVRPVAAQMKRLLNLHEQAGQLARAAPFKLAHPEVARSLEEALIHVMIRCLTEGVAIGTEIAARDHRTALSKFEEALSANCDRPLYLRDICATIGVSERTLRRCCHEHLGMGPVRYLWLRRMHLARLAFMRADPATATVTGIATDHGFWELGRFSVEYRKLFGESPSASLHGPPNARLNLKNRPSDLPVTVFA